MTGKGWSLTGTTSSESIMYSARGMIGPEGTYVGQATVGALSPEIQESDSLPTATLTGVVQGVCLILRSIYRTKVFWYHFWMTDERSELKSSNNIS